MTLIGDDGTVFDILQHVVVQSPLDLFMYDEDDFANMKAKINNKNTPIPFRCQKLLVLFQKFHIYRQSMQLPHQPDDWITEYTIDAFNELSVSTNIWDPI